MKPVPETVEALRALRLGDGDRGDLADLERLSSRVEALVPTCTGMSIVQAATGITFTFVVPGTPLQRPTPLFAKLDESLGETGPPWSPIDT